MEPTNVAIIGCGNLGSRHARNLAHLPDVHVAACVDRDPTQTARLRDELKAISGQVQPLLTNEVSSVLADPNIHAVVIATHHDSHPDLAIAAAEAGKHIFIEKPLALTVEACRAIEAAVERAGVQLIVGFQARHAPLVRRAQTWVPQPRVVVGQLVASRWGDDSWAQKPETGGGNVLSQGVHSFDLLAQSAVSAPLVIHAEGGTITHDPATTDVIDSVVVTIRFANGVIGSAVIGDFGPSPWTELAFYELFDAQGRSATIYHYMEGLCLGTAGSRVVSFAPETEPAQTISVADLPPDERDDPYGYSAQLIEFIDCVRTGRPPVVAATARDGRRATAMVLASFESIRTGQPVTLDD